MTVYFSVIFELILPYYSSRYTRDFIDILAYGLGAYIYSIYQSKYLLE